MATERLGKAAGLPLKTVKRAEFLHGEAGGTIAHAESIQRALEAAEVEFTSGDQPGVRLKARG